MKQKRIIVLLLSVFILVSCGKSYVLKSEEGNFSVSFPGKPAESKRTVPTAEGEKIDIVSYNYLDEDSTVIYILSYSNIPNSADNNPDSILETAKIGPAQAMRTSIVEEKKLDLNGNPGIYFKGLGLDIAMVYHIYIVKDRMYQLAILNNIPREPEKTEIEQFMGSFKLLKP